MVGEWAGLFEMRTWVMVGVIGWTVWDEGLG